MIRRTPLKRSTKPIKRISTKQREREADLKRRKIARIVASLEADGLIRCERCPAFFLTLSGALMGLAGHHIKRRHHADDSDENISLICHSCHRAEHGQAW